MLGRVKGRFVGLGGWRRGMMGLIERAEHDFIYLDVTCVTPRCKVHFVGKDTGGVDVVVVAESQNQVNIFLIIRV